MPERMRSDQEQLQVLVFFHRLMSRGIADFKELDNYLLYQRDKIIHKTERISILDKEGKWIELCNHYG